MIYHYCAIYRDQETGATIYMDGLLVCKTLIEDMASYRAAKACISEQHQHELTITSLTALPETVNVLH